MGRPLEASLPARRVPAGHPTPREILREPLGGSSPQGSPRANGGGSWPGWSPTIELADPAIAVSIELGTPAGAAMIDALAAAGARVVNVAGRTAEAYLSPDGLAALARLDDVRAIRPIRRDAAAGYVSPAVTLHGSSRWQAAGLTGAGVKVGIIDGGFAGMAARLGTELPARVTARCYTSVGSFSTDPGDCDNGEPHGTAVAEAIFDMAPGIELYVPIPISRLDEQRVITWMTDNGVRIINASFYSGQIFEGPGDGTSPYDTSLYARSTRRSRAGRSGSTRRATRATRGGRAPGRTRTTTAGSISRPAWSRTA